MGHLPPHLRQHPLFGQLAPLLGPNGMFGPHGLFGGPLPGGAFPGGLPVRAHGLPAGAQFLPGGPFPGGPLDARWPLAGGGPLLGGLPMAGALPMPGGVPAGFSAGDFAIGDLGALAARLLEWDQRHGHAHGRPGGSAPAAEAAIASLPRQSVDAAYVARHAGALACTVCMEDLAEGDTAVGMPCDHTFHEACLLPWLAAHSTCPTCRAGVSTDKDLL